MKILFTIALFCCQCSVLFSQHQHTNSSSADTLAPYLKTNQLPNFKILVQANTKDSVWFRDNNIPKDASTALIYFSPDCSHCEHEAKEILKHMDSLKFTQIVFISYRPLDEIIEFAKKFKLNTYPNIVFGRDTQYFMAPFYQIKFTPFVALYNSNRSLLKVYEQGADISEMIALLN